MESYFRELSELLCARLTGDEVLLLNYQGETSDFVRLNKNKIRQAGRVQQQTLYLALIVAGRECTATFSLSSRREEDFARAEKLLRRLREKLGYLPEDPHLHFATMVHHTAHCTANQLPAPNEAIDTLIDAASGLDLVGLWASGEMSHGFANSLGQFNWHSSFNFNLNWSLYRETDKAVKQDYAGFTWDPNALVQRITAGRETLALLGQRPKRLEPGKYRVYLAPSALYELLQLLNWGAFGLKSHRTAQTPLLRMVREGATLHHAVTLRENHADGLTPCFTRGGFIKPDIVELIREGAYRDCLANARSAKEYGVSVNCGIEHPKSLELTAGDLHAHDVFTALDTGLHISNLWYCNYSDRNLCRITGMTRFACLWVEKGRPVAPLEVMRFDETIFHILGDCLEGLTRERERIIDSSSYEWRSDASAWLPGALVKDFTLTL